MKSEDSRCIICNEIIDPDAPIRVFPVIRTITSRRGNVFPVCRACGNMLSVVGTLIESYRELKFDYEITEEDLKNNGKN